jgi:hypothetical protein
MIFLFHFFEPKFNSFDRIPASSPQDIRRTDAEANIPPALLLGARTAKSTE